jgi:hypothetical protein
MIKYKIFDDITNTKPVEGIGTYIPLLLWEDDKKTHFINFNIMGNQASFLYEIFDKFERPVMVSRYISKTDMLSELRLPSYVAREIDLFLQNNVMKQIEKT